jgi:hypothetical protein
MLVPLRKLHVGRPASYRFKRALETGIATATQNARRSEQRALPANL